MEPAPNAHPDRQKENRYKAVAAAKPAPKKPVKKTTPRNPAAKKTKYLRVEQIFSGLEGAYPDAKCALDHTNPLQLLVATILSAQSTDKMVNTITPALFKKYRTAEQFANADTAELETLIHSSGFFRRSDQASPVSAGRKQAGSIPGVHELDVKIA